MFLAIFRPLTGNKTSLNYFFLVEEVLSLDLVGHMWKSVKNWLQEWVFNIYKWKWGRSRWTEYFENYLQKWFVETLVGKSCLKFLQENLAKNSCGKILWEILAGKSCGKLLQENLVENSCGKLLQEILWEIVAGKSCVKFLWEMLWEIPQTYLLLPVRGLKMAKNADISNFWHIFCHF